MSELKEEKTLPMEPRLVSAAAMTRTDEELEAAMGAKDVVITMKTHLSTPAVLGEQYVVVTPEEEIEGLRDGSLLPEGIDNPMVAAIQRWREQGGP